ncbi:N-acetyltransferase [Tenacibaculum sp. SZ-18]|uniref:GNAT family N-acetyltransferase n=1 Tax=Tenacibaculum sp. SZ-18 TaxID=754423 RepID=UPI000C2D150D|nr:GNAT family N-acetyltransferase [Tenacibaculum sp. SZ-18]AUC16848.1 N-acetyltransferase [Tenacibaculum sp. SZ-18]
MTILPLKKEHWPQFAEIYKEGILTGNATFRTQVPDWKTWDSNCHKHSRFIMVQEEEVLGWCTLAPVSKRFEYRGVAEVSVYIKLNSLGKGIGASLMEKLIESSEENGIWTLYSSMFSENNGSVRLHEKFGFRKVGYRERIAQLNGVWRDTVIYE